MLNYKAPKLHKQANEWVIEYELQHPDTGEWHRFKKRKGLNKKGITAAARKQNASDAIAAILELIKSGAENPWSTLEQKNTLSTKEALLQALEFKKPDVEESTYKEYRYSLNAFLSACEATGSAQIDIDKFKRKHVIAALDHLRANGISDFKWNLHKKRMSSLLSLLVEREVIEMNPILYGVKNKAVPEPTKFEPPTDEEQRRIDVHLYENHRAMFVFKSVIYATGARPGELLKLKVEQVDFKNAVIEVRASQTKVGKRKTLPLVDELAGLLVDHLQSAQPGDYVFGRKLLPGRNKIHITTFQTQWRKVVKSQKTGLGIDTNPYAQKHYGTDKKILAGIQLDDLRQMYGHGSKRMTEKYAKELKNKAFEEIKKKSPGIIPK